MYLLGLKYLEALPKITEGAGTTIFLPAEATGVMGALGGLRELLTRSNSNPAPRQPKPAPAPTSPATPPQLAPGDDKLRPDL
jgi:hypothetical protein